MQIFSHSAANAIAIDVTIRAANATDLLCISMLATHVFLDTYAHDGMREALAREVQQTLSVAAFSTQLTQPDTSTLVAESGGHMIALCQLRFNQAHALLASTTAMAAAELVRLYVHERFTGRGVGTGLLRHAETLAANGGAATLWLTAWVANTRALAFYARRGYVDSGATDYVFEKDRFENRLFVKSIKVGTT